MDQLLRRGHFSPLLSARTWGGSLAAGSWTGPATVAGTGPLALAAGTPRTQRLLLVLLGSSAWSSASRGERLLTATSVISSKVVAVAAAWQREVRGGLSDGF